MGHIYRELHEIPIPDDAYINHYDGRVFLISNDGNGHQKRQVIGIATSNTMMHPNHAYKYLYPELWKEYYGGKELPEHELHVGMYAACLGIASKNGLYPLLHEAYGPLYGNAIMDYCMYSMYKRTDTTQLYQDTMNDQVKFSDETYSDSWFSALFKTYMSANANHQFRIGWLKKVASEGIKKAWLCIDGSNDDCAITDSRIAEKGKAKSHLNKNIVSFIWAVSAEDGMPLTYFVNNGGMVDSKAFMTITEFLKSAGIAIEGVILDRGFCNHEVITELKDKGYSYVVMLKSNTHAHEQMFSKYSEEIRWKVKYVVNNDGIFGITDTQKLFTNYNDIANVGLFYDGINGGARSVHLIKKILMAKKDADQSVKKGEKPSVPRQLSSYFDLQQEESGKWNVSYRYDAWQKDIDSRGFYSIATSKEMGAEELYRTYYLRDASEKQFMIMKSQLGFDTVRVHNDQSLENKLAVCFIASIIRAEIMKTCKKLGYDTNTVILGLNRISLVLMVDGTYKAVNNISGHQQEVLTEFGIKNDYFRNFADDVNRRINNPINSQIHRLPEDPESPGISRKRGRPPKKKTETAEIIKRSPGRPKGSKNKKTLSHEATQDTTQPIKRKPGRPKGSKNKPKTESIKRGPGRPKKNKSNNSM